MLQHHPLQSPVAFIAGTRSAEIRQGGLETARRLAGERLGWLEGTPLYPTEKPVATAEKVLTLLASMRPA